MTKDVDLGLKADTVTGDEIEHLLRMGDDDYNGSLRITRDGRVILSQTATGNERLDDIAFYFETLSAGISQMGQYARLGDLPQRMATKIHENWPLYKNNSNRRCNYIDDF
jgi:hypothetical protein